MIDPVSIGIAFSVAQSSVNNIKKAIALGKDIHSLTGEFVKFFNSSDTVHTASVKLKAKNVGKSDSELGAVALELAMNSKRLRDAEKELKELLIYSGNGDIWEEMLRERTRLIKERNAAEREMINIKAKQREQMAEDLMLGAIFIMVVFLLYVGFKIWWQFLIRN
jgi:arsenate reductase-like glutaredoxin family protein